MIEATPAPRTRRAHPDLTAPHDDGARPPARRRGSTPIGMAILLGACVMLFAALFLAYGVVRVQATSGPRPARRRSPGAPGRELARAARGEPGAAPGRGPRGRRSGAAFLGAQALIWRAWWRATSSPARALGSVFYALTGFHALHVLAGVVALALTGARGCASDDLLGLRAGDLGGGLRRRVPAVRAAAFLLLLAAPACTRTVTLPGAPPPFTAPVTLGGRVVAPAALEHGREVYTHYCRPCHGDAGDGKGTAAAGLPPPPRDLRLGVYKFAAVAAGQLPTDADFVRIIRRGLHGTAMQAWDVPDAELDDLIEYAKAFAPRWRTETAGDPIVARPIRGRAARPRGSTAASASTTASPSARSPATPPTSPSRRSTPSRRS